jgi:hypothetical protein
VTIGAQDKKKVQALVAIVVIGGGYALYSNLGDSSSSSSSSSSGSVAAPVTQTPPVRVARAAVQTSRRASGHNAGSEFEVRLGPRTEEERPDPATIDPTLRLDLLAKVQNVELGSPGRNLFDFGSAPPPEVVLPKEVPKIAINNKPPPPPVMPVGGPMEPAKPQAPPMTFKYYGYKVSSTDGHKAAFLLDGDDILVAGENDTVKRRYRVVKIGVNSITMEDTEFKSTQTLPLQENAG